MIFRYTIFINLAFKQSKEDYFFNVQLENLIYFLNYFISLITFSRNQKKVLFRLFLCYSRQTKSFSGWRAIRFNEK